MSKFTQEIYRKIYQDLVQSLKEDQILRKSFTQEEVLFIEQVRLQELEEEARGAKRLS